MRMSHDDCALAFRSFPRTCGRTRHSPAALWTFPRTAIRAESHATPRLRWSSHTRAIREGITGLPIKREREVVIFFFMLRRPEYGVVVSPVRSFRSGRRVSRSVLSMFCPFSTALRMVTCIQATTAAMMLRIVFADISLRAPQMRTDLVPDVSHGKTRARHGFGLVIRARYIARIQGFVCPN